MPDIQCPVVGCDYSTGDVDSVVVAALLNAHTVGAHTSSQPVKQRQPPKVERPQLSDAIDEESWNAFKQDWTMFTLPMRLLQWISRYSYSPVVILLSKLN